MNKREYEKDAFSLYQNLFSQANFPCNTIQPITEIITHKDLDVQTFGLCINSEKPWYGTSPDGAVNCSCGYGVMGIKCPYSI